MNKLIQKILIGKLFRFFPKHPLFVIIGVKINSNNFCEMLVAQYNENFNSAVVFSWYYYHQTQIYFEKRSPKEQIIKCLKTNPDKIKYHIGKSVNVKDIKIYDEYNLYKKYLKL